MGMLIFRATGFSLENLEEYFVEKSGVVFDRKPSIEKSSSFKISCQIISRSRRSSNYEYAYSCYQDFQGERNDFFCYALGECRSLEVFNPQQMEVLFFIWKFQIEIVSVGYVGFERFLRLVSEDMTHHVVYNKFINKENTWQVINFWKDMKEELWTRSFRR